MVDLRPVTEPHEPGFVDSPPIDAAIPGNSKRPEVWSSGTPVRVEQCRVRPPREARMPR